MYQSTHEHSSEAQSQVRSKPFKFKARYTENHSHSFILRKELSLGVIYSRKRLQRDANRFRQNRNSINRNQKNLIYVQQMLLQLLPFQTLPS